MSQQKISEDLPNATSSRESPGGRGPCNSLVSHQMSLFGQAHAPANPFRAPGNKKAQTTKDTCGLNSTASSASARPPIVFGEQVASKLGLEWLAGVRLDLEACGYAVGAADLPAACVAAPHKRQRLFWVADAADER